MFNASFGNSATFKSKHSSGSGGGSEGAMPPGPVKISHKKDGHQRQRHRFHVSRPPYLAAGSATEAHNVKKQTNNEPEIIQIQSDGKST